ncbi:DUF11 domain-containing protein [Deinococcus aerophilus]|uniref:DUF11 domain-containing protein n=1 Tax=Deinococcus aerophilus TaxID=522488 RepID=A0ABQ2GYY6_9DEIO|nr:DUF11 domain-containing protein [Deinococcus aerophilus]GGM18826.1 hypothetical protein GCM10010841_28680 [Deinococcus aerophilus]
MKHLHKLLQIMFSVGVLVTTGQASAQQTPAGTVITNQAQAEYLPPSNGEPGRAFSNTVRTTVSAVCAVSVTPDGTVAQPGQSASLMPGDRAVFAYRMVNAGNSAFAFPVAGRTEPGSVSGARLQVVRDTNGNGQPDANEPVVGAVTLDADAHADLLLVVDGAASGDTYVTLVAACDGGQSDDNNVSVVQTSPPAQLAVGKSFAPALVRPGAETTVTVDAQNVGQGPSREVLVSDPLAEQIAQGMSFVPGSARTDRGTLEYTADGMNWSAQEPQPVSGVRVRLPGLTPGEAVRLTFRLLAGASAENRTILNVASATTRDQTVRGSAGVEVRYRPAVAIGPVGVPEAPEGTPADSQIRAFAALGQPVCFDHTALNTGDVRDDFLLTFAFTQGAATVILYGADGQLLAQPLSLDPGQSAAVRVCYAATQTGPLDALLTLGGTRGESNTTRDGIQGVEAGLPEVRKAYQASALEDGRNVFLPQGATVSAGDTVAYTLTVRNPYTRPLTGVVVRDPLPAHVDFVSATEGGRVTGEPGTQTVGWTLGTLAPGEARTLDIVTRVASRAVDGEALRNTFTLTTAELTEPVPSNEVTTPVWTARLVVDKTVSAGEVAPGDRLTYTLKITNRSATTAIVDARVTDTPARGLAYLPGTSALNGAALADPQITDGVLVWTLAELPAGATITLTYQTRVTPEASGDLVNTVTVSGTGAGGLARAVASNRAVATTKLKLLTFAPRSDIVGVVYVDRNRDGRYDEGLDTPLPRARVLLAGGRQVLTDSQGRYSFPEVPSGMQALRLDPNTTPYPPLRTPRDGGLSGTQTVFVNGLTSVDFPLAPLGGEVLALRRTTLTVSQGDTTVTLDKAVYGVEGGYLVTLRITTPRPLTGVDLGDPLPAGATLKEGRKNVPDSLPAGETTFTYRFDWEGEPRAATTDPALSWRD